MFKLIQLDETKTSPNVNIVIILDILKISAIEDQDASNVLEIISHLLVTNQQMLYQSDTKKKSPFELSRMYSFHDFP